MENRYSMYDVYEYGIYGKISHNTLLPWNAETSFSLLFPFTFISPKNPISAMVGSYFFQILLHVWVLLPNACQVVIESILQVTGNLPVYSIDDYIFEMMAHASLYGIKFWLLVASIDGSWGHSELMFHMTQTFQYLNIALSLIDVIFVTSNIPWSISEIWNV